MIVLFFFEKANSWGGGKFQLAKSCWGTQGLTHSAPLSSPDLSWKHGYFAFKQLLCGICLLPDVVGCFLELMNWKILSSIYGTVRKMCDSH